MRGSFGGAVSTAAIESYLVSQNATKDPYDILYGVAGGFVLGGAIGAALGKSDKELLSAMQSMDTAARNAQVEDIGKVIQQKGFTTETEIPKSALPEVALPSTFDPSAGAMANPWSRPVQIPDLRTDTNDFLLDIGQPAFSDLPLAPKLSMTGQLKNLKFLPLGMLAIFLERMRLALIKAERLWSLQQTSLKQTPQKLILLSFIKYIKLPILIGLKAKVSDI